MCHAWCLKHIQLCHLEIGTNAVIFALQHITQLMLHFTLLDDNTPWLSNISGHLINKIPIVLCVGWLFQDCFYSEWPQRVVILFPFNGETEIVSGKLATNMKELTLEFVCHNLNWLCFPVGLWHAEPAWDILKLKLLLLLWLRNCSSALSQESGIFFQYLWNRRSLMHLFASKTLLMKDHTILNKHTWRSINFL